MSGLTLHSPLTLQSHFNHSLTLYLHFHSLHTLSLIQSSLFNYIFNSLSFNPSSFLLSKPPFPFHFIIILLIQLYFYFSINLQFTLFHFTCPHHFFFLNLQVAFGNLTYQLNYYHHLHHYPHPIIHSSITPPHHFFFNLQVAFSNIIQSSLLMCFVQYFQFFSLCPPFLSSPLSQLPWSGPSINLNSQSQLTSIEGSSPTSVSSKSSSSITELSIHTI